MPEGKVVSINLIGNLENSIRIKAQKVLKEKALYDWLEYLKRIENSGYGELVIKGFSKTSLDIIGKFGFLPIKIFYSTLSSVTIKKGQKISYNFCNVCSEILEFYDNDKKFLSMIKRQKNEYGEGNASKKIIDILENIDLDTISIQKKIEY